jgi:hypothetical protein
MYKLWHRNQGVSSKYSPLGEKLGFELGDTVLPPGRIDEFLGELGFGSCCRLIFIEELAAVALVGGGILGCDERGVAGKAVGKCILRRTLFAGGGAGTGGESRIRAVRANARLCGWGFAIRVLGWGLDLS